MNFWLTEKGVLRCSHRGPLGGKVSVKTTQNFVRIQGGSVNVEANTKGCDVSSLSCAILKDATKGIFPCKKTITAVGGYSKFVTIEGKPICLDNITGNTLSNPGPGTYSVRNAGQNFVRGD